ncbi:methanol metabolism-related c-type cytochrome [Angulomicrobium tetraedrale]|uniref:Methanol metabolism-related c-type cytochrome n=1 Tax=Ancylobacter tetraedralis TaxID=217068 RepID=A0A839Z0A4_9HYPH|nr:c-type cytochrome, methanol metabolism-related [Ancylobacter tetraedralis]MBB3770184.1 methanol metabolism-related c-type cytochrome [Ancylobacter tetraedralis]
MTNSARGWLVSGILPASARLSALVLGAVVSAALVLPAPSHAQDAGATAAKPATEAKEKDDLGKYTLPDGDPTYNIAPDGTLDWYTYSGYRRYHAECHVCHGPDGMGSSYAPALADSLKTLTYAQFMETVVNGKKNIGVGTADQVMPAFGENKNVMCYLDDIYVYLKARADGTLGRERPSKREDKTKAYTANENQCFGRPG